MGVQRVIIISTILGAATASAQQNSDVSIMGGLTQSAKTTISGTTIQVSSPVGASWEVNYGYQIKRGSIAELWIETPIVGGYRSSSTISGAGNVSAVSDSLFTFTPGVRVRIPTRSRLSIYGIGGLGFGRFSHYQTLIQPAALQVESAYSMHATFDVGGGGDLRLTRLVSLRMEARDFIATGKISSGNRRNHAVYEFGIAFHF
jgi:hypothetical protein